MKNIFTALDTISCIESTFVGKEIGGGKTLTKEDIRKIFHKYRDFYRSAFGGRIIVMQKHRFDETAIPAVSYEYVREDTGVRSYEPEGYYAITINDYKVRDVMNSGVYLVMDNQDLAKNIIGEIAADFSGDVSESTVAAVLYRFLCGTEFDSFYNFMSSYVNGRHKYVDESIAIFMTVLKHTCSFDEDCPSIGSPKDLLNMAVRCSKLGLTVGLSNVSDDDKDANFYSFLKSVVPGIQNVEPPPSNGGEETNDGNGENENEDDGEDEGESDGPAKPDPDPAPAAGTPKCRINTIRADIQDGETPKSNCGGKCGRGSCRCGKQGDECGSESQVGDDQPKYTYRVFISGPDGKGQSHSYTGSSMDEIRAKCEKDGVPEIGRFLRGKDAKDDCGCDENKIAERSLHDMIARGFSGSRRQSPFCELFDSIGDAFDIMGDAFDRFF